MDKQFINEFEATGRIVSMKKYGNNSTLITLFINNPTGRDAYPQFVCENKLLPQNLKHHTNVFIKGSVSVYPLYDQHTGEKKYWQRFSVSHMERAKTLTELKFGVKGKFAAESYMNIYLKGEIKEINTNKDWYNYLIFTGTHSLTVGMRKLERHLSLKEGDTICCVCKVSTIEKETKGQTVRFENILVTDLAKIEG